MREKMRKNAEKCRSLLSPPPLHIRYSGRSALVPHCSHRHWCVDSFGVQSGLCLQSIKGISHPVTQAVGRVESSLHQEHPDHNARLAQCVLLLLQ